jgi:predicted nuclease of predicted toxin-antitoxin system
MTKFLVDESIPHRVVSFLRSKGFDVKTLELLMLHIGH